MRWLLLTMLGLAGCSRELPLGSRCEKTSQCGRGADCYQSVCTPMCANDSECADTSVCVRYHCLTATGEPGVVPTRPRVHVPAREVPPSAPTTDAPNAKADASQTRPGLRNPAVKLAPQPDVASELRAIHTELEAIRQEQQRQAEILQHLNR